MTKITAPVRHNAVPVPAPNVHGAVSVPKAQSGLITDNSSFGGYVKTPPPPSAYARQVAGMSDAQLRQEAKSLKLQLLMADFPLGVKANVSELKKKLGVVEGQLHARQLSTTSRFAYERQVGGMSDKQLTSARNHEVVERMTAKLRGDVGGVREADAKLAIIDREISSRKGHGLTEFLDGFNRMGRGEQQNTLQSLLGQVTNGLGQGGDFESVEQPFGRLTSVLGLATNAAQGGSTQAPAEPKKAPAPSPGDVIGNIFKALFDPFGFFSGLLS